MMLKSWDAVSAFAVYNLKRKNTELKTNSKKLKKKHVSHETKVSKVNGKMKKAKLASERRNVGAVIKKKNDGVFKKTDLPVTSKKSKSIEEKDETVNRIPVSDSKKVIKKRKLKTSFLTVNTGLASIKQIESKQRKLTKSKRLRRKIDRETNPTECRVTKENHENPIEKARAMFQWLINPFNAEEFFSKMWEKKAVHVHRENRDYYKMLMSTPMIDKILRDFEILYTRNIDITSYENGVRETHNPVGRAVPSVVWDYYMNGCSIRMINPQTYIPQLHSLNATLQEYFNCFVGANFYLTPPNSQGFAPHYDDIEAFILQIEGKKRWRLYNPRNNREYLPRYSSENISRAELGEPFFDIVLQAGDLLYFPRGTIHEGQTIDDTHSLHITLSVYQKNSWCDLFEKLLPDALSTAIEKDHEFRTGLPIDYLYLSGCTRPDVQNKSRHMFEAKIRHLFSKLIEHIDIDKAVDLMGKNHVHDCLPPSLSERERKCSVIEDGERMTANGIVQNMAEIELDTRIRLLRSHCVRLVKEDQTFKLYYSTENSKVYHEYEPQFLEVDEEFVPTVRHIIMQYPNFIRVKDLPISGEDNKIQIVKDLWEKCIVTTEKPLCFKQSM